MKTLRVAQVCTQAPMHALVVQQDTPLEEVIRDFASDHTLRGIFLVDDAGRLAGVINRHDLLAWARFQFNLSSRSEPLRLSQVRRMVSAAHACDLAAPGSRQAAVRPEDSLEDALERMARYDLTDIPVVDAAGRIVDDLRLSEVLLSALSAQGEAHEVR